MEERITTADVRARIEEEYADDELLVADGFDDAIIGVAAHWGKDGQQTAVAYDYDACVRILQSKGLSEDAAQEWLSVNTLGAYVGPTTPVFVHIWRRV